jgi:hypothetical protein
MDGRPRSYVFHGLIGFLVLCEAKSIEPQVLPSFFSFKFDSGLVNVLFVRLLEESRDRVDVALRRRQDHSIKGIGLSKLLITYRVSPR